MSKKRTHDMTEITTKMEMHLNNNISTPNCEQTEIQITTPVCILLNIGIDY